MEPIYVFLIFIALVTVFIVILGITYWICFVYFRSSDSEEWDQNIESNKRMVSKSKESKEMKESIPSIVPTNELNVTPSATTSSAVEMKTKGK